MKRKIQIFAIITIVVFIFPFCSKESSQYSITNIEWEVYKINQTSYALWSWSSPYPYTILFQDDGRFIMELEFNTCQGEYSIKYHNKIKIESINCTEFGGEDEFADSLINIFRDIYIYKVVELGYDNPDELELYAPTRIISLADVNK